MEIIKKIIDNYIDSLNQELHYLTIKVAALEQAPYKNTSKYAMSNLALEWCKAKIKFWESLMGR